jgi:hypothetical protein
MIGQVAKQAQQKTAHLQGLHQASDASPYMSQTMAQDRSIPGYIKGGNIYQYSGDLQFPKANMSIDPALEVLFASKSPPHLDDVTHKIATGDFGFTAWPEDTNFTSPGGSTDFMSRSHYGKHAFEGDSTLYPQADAPPSSHIHGVDPEVKRGERLQLPDAVFSRRLDNPANALRFADLSTAILAAKPLQYWVPLKPDLSIPTTDLDRQQWVLKLLNAINNTTNVFDAASRKFTKHWVSNPPYYSATAKELVAWNILSLAESLHTKGPSALLSFDTNFWKNAAKSRTWTFEERMKQIIELLMCSKARCEKLLAGLGTQSVVSNPDAMLRMTKDNGKRNGKRQAVLEAGRPGKKRKIS